MAAGFLNVIPPFGLSGFPAAGPDGGFDTPIPGLRLSGGGGGPPVGQLGGFGTPIGALLIRSAGHRPAGFFSLIPGIRLGGFAEADEGERGRRTYFTYIGRTRLGR